MYGIENGADLEASERIDQQLYTKYNLSEDEIQFIESMIKSM